MTPEKFFSGIVEPCLKFMADSPGIAIPVSPAATILVMTIAGQESAWAHRRQIGGPANGYWQFERGGGVVGVLTHPATALKAKAICGLEDVPSDVDTVYDAIIWHDRLACAMARLLLWSDPAPLPAVGDKHGAWNYYERNWRPGAPHPDAWGGRYDQAVAAIGTR